MLLLMWETFLSSNVRDIPFIQSQYLVIVSLWRPKRCGQGRNETSGQQYTHRHLVDWFGEEAAEANDLCC